MSESEGYGPCFADAVLGERAGFQQLSELLPDTDQIVIHPAANDARQSLSYAALRAFVAQTRCALRSLGIRPADRVAVLLPNGPSSATALFAFTAGCCYAPLSQSLSPMELQWALQDLPAAAAVIPSDHSLPLDMREAIDALGIPMIFLTESVQTAGLFTLTAPANGCSPPPRAAVECGDEPSERPPDEPVLMLHTSGTTARPKLVPLSVLNLGGSALCIAKTLELSRADVCLNMMPLHHLHGIAVNVLATAVAGASVVCARGLTDAAEFFSVAASAGVTWYSAVPSIHLSIVEHQEQQQPEALPMLRLIRNCSAALLPSVAERLEAAFGCVVLPTYAMTECIP